MKSVIAATALLAVTATIALAQTGPDAIKARKDMMSGIAKSGRAVGAAFKGEAPFDLAAAKTWFGVVQTNLGKAKDLFPDDSKTGEDTRAAPAIWEKKAEFAKLFDSAIAAAKEAQDKTTDEATFKVEYKKLGDACGACHKDFRLAQH